ncbi:Glycosyltransferase involved in cell wall bisynthesis [Neorhodopirellula lusitana]|uniref:Glycosyltransferase involved in cell wall bisynthesis n=1 Tax=Neorhodopirellula lusitana TaxID=445327 RepID=A0ABY1Q0W6_9BACT|nr:glycosyltransferase family 1 protein [Neorhodopirellula lusitana]SMP55936.1 Glycosyltransferase involved in cell wall bisynthesis [Neorhodopirellula lusitana]
MKDSSPNIRVSFDASVLAAAQVNPHARTGVFRVTDRLARFLLQRDDIDLNWIVSGNTDVLPELVQLIQDDPSLKRPIQASLRRRKCIAQAKKIFDYLAAKGLQSQLHWLTSSLASMQSNSTFSACAVSEADILHSPYHALPELDQSPKRPIGFLTVHDLIPIRFPEWFAVGAKQRLLKALASLTPDDWVLCISESTRIDLLNHLPDLNQEQIRVTPLAADSRFQQCNDVSTNTKTRLKYGIPPDCKYFLSVCTLEPRKNLRHLVSVFNEARSNFDSDTRLILAGAKGWEIDELLESLTDTERNQIVVTGYVDDADLSPLYSNAIAFIYPSLYEGFGLPPLEAMQCGTPVIAADNSSLPEVIGDAGILVPANDADELADAMTRVFQDASLRAKMSSAGIQRASQFSWQRCGNLTVQAYQDALRQR